MMSIMEKRKGKRVELYIVALLRKNGIDAKRIPLSGATDFQKGDVIAYDNNGIPYILEVKARQKGFADIRARIIHKGICKFFFRGYEYFCYSWDDFINKLKGKEIDEQTTEKVRAYKQIANWLYDTVVDYLVIKIDRQEPFVIERRIKNDR
mgnify:CR=1 FL=1